MLGNVTCRGAKARPAGTQGSPVVKPGLGGVISGQRVSGSSPRLCQSGCITEGGGWLRVAGYQAVRLCCTAGDAELGEGPPP